MRITLREVAEYACVSKASVSYVLNGKGDSQRINPETRTRIMEAAKKLGYHPNALARGLANRHTHTVAIVMQYPLLFAGWSGFTNALMHGVTDAALEYGYDLLLHTRRSAQDWQGQNLDGISADIARLTDGRADGALLLRDIDDPLTECLHENEFPAVLMFTHSDNPDLWYVDCDNIAGGRMAANHLMDLGHTRIVHLCGSPRSGAASERREGYITALKNRGVPVRNEWMCEVTSPIADFSEALALFQTNKSDRPTAVFAWSDDVAIQMMRELHELGFRVPDDVAMVGFDSTVLCDHTDPPLTSVCQPVHQMAVQAMALLHNHIEGEVPEVTQIRISPSLDIRRSCGASIQL